MISKGALASIVLVLLVASMGIVSAHIYSQQTSYVGQTIKNKPYYYVNQLSNIDSSADKGAHSNFTAQKYGPDSTFDTLNEENVGEASVTEDFVDYNTSDFDSSVDKGSHGNFSAQQYGPDVVYDLLTEENTGSFSNSTLLDDGFEDFIWDTNWNNIPGNWVEDNYPVHSGFASARAAEYSEGYFTCDSLDASDATAIYVDFWFRKTGTEYSDFTLYYYDGFSYDFVDELDDNGGDNSWIRFTAKITDSQYLISNFRIRFDASLGYMEEVWVDDVVIAKEIQIGNNYELDLEVQWTNVVDFLPNEELCICTGALGSEDLRVDYWSGSDWANLSADLSANGWNNFTVSLTSAAFAIRFEGGSETGDTTEDQWEIDAVLLKCWGTGSKEDTVDNNSSDVDSSADKGSHGNFSAQQYGPDTIYDTLTEEDPTSFGKKDIGSSSRGYTGYLEASNFQCQQDTTIAQISLYLSGG